jgi:NADH:ubiquinone oxidoreductase subunit F (NADH-binding)
LKALQAGHSGSFLAPRDFDVLLDSDSLRTAGCNLAPSLLTAFDADDCAVEMARQAASASHLASCGQCSFGREGTRQLAGILADLTRGRGRDGDLELLLRIGQGMKAGSLCPNGRNAPDAVVTALALFRPEFEQHLNARHCAAALCWQDPKVEK